MEEQKRDFLPLLVLSKGLVKFDINLCKKQKQSSKKVLKSRAAVQYFARMVHLRTHGKFSTMFSCESEMM